MTENLKLYLLVLGATPEGRLIEQHDVFFGVGHNLKELVPQIKAFWPEAKGKIHIDSYREITNVDGYQIKVVERQESNNALRLFFINLGGYKFNELEEHHYKVVAVAENMAEASKISKKTAFYKHYGFKGAASHIDDKYGLDVDDIYNVNDLLPSDFLSKYSLEISEDAAIPQDELHIGYLKIEKVEKQ